MKKIIQILCLVGIGLGFFNTANAQCNAQLAYWDFNDCTKGLMIRDGLPPQTAVAGCPSAVTTSISRIELKNSCADRAADNRANCLGGNNLTAWQDGADDAVVITVSYPAGSTGKLSGLSFIQGLHDIAEFNGEPNNPPTLWGIRVVKNGTEIFQEIDKPFVLNAWTLRTFDWSSNAAFNVSGTTTFRIELLGYKPSTTINVGAPHNIWEIDDVKILGGCCTITPSCSLTSGGLTAVTCKNNSTTSVTTDDYIEFKLNPTGTGLGSQYTVSASGGATITPTSATYGVATTFRLQNGSAGGGNKTITIKDKTNTSCSTTVTVTDPGTCSTTPACSISGTVSNITCNNNSTTAVTTDDKIVFQLKVTGTGTGSSYNVSVQGGGTISPTSGTYGSTVTFTMASGTAGGGNKTIVITDATTGTCTISKTISDPGNCSASCSISATVSAITCNDNGTASASGDDKITFTLNATGNGVAANYNVSVQGGGTITPTSGAYGSNVTFTLGAGTAGGGNKTIVITDATTGTCTRTVTITDPGSCSNSCPTTTYHICNSESYRLTAQAGLTNYQWMVDTGTGYTNVSGGNTQIINVSTAGKYKYTAKDGSGCDIELCCPYEITKTTLTATGLASTVCNNNSTTTDPLDDKITFTLNPTGTGLSGTYNVSVQGGGSITPTSASYGVATTFTLSEGSAGGGNKVIIIADEDHPTCTINANITDPGACSCPLTAANISGIACSNNGTTSTTDDRIKFILHPTGPAGGTYTVSVNSGTVSPTTGIYGMPTLFVLNAGSAGGGNKTVTVTDDDYPTCKVTVTVTDPGPCSSCQLNDPLVAYVVCDNKGTATTADDEFILYANPNGLGISATYNASATCSGVACTCSKTNVAYGSPQEICRLPKGFGTATVTVTDASGATCNVVGTVAEGTCGVSCNIAASGLNIVCNGSTYTIYLNPTGTGLSTRYHVTGDYNFAFVPYGAAFAIVVDVPINSGAKTITITDANSAACKLVVNIPNQTCVACVKPTLGATVTTVAGTCTGTTANNDATASLTVTGGDKADIVEGATYGSGPAYNAASNKTVTSGSVSFMGLKHNTQYTIRVWNADNTCFEDKTFTTPTKDCSCTNPVLTDLTDQSICVGGSFTPANVTTSVTNGVSVTYQWYNDNGTANPTTTAISGQQAAALTALPTTAGVYKYRVEATNTADNTCKASKLVTLTIVAPANAGTNGSTSVCDNSTTAINLFDLITGESPGGVWTRTTGTGGTFNAAAGTFTPALGAISSTFTYTVTGTAPCPNATSVATVNITAYRTAGTSGNTAICDNSTTVINLFDLITGESPGGVWTRTSGTGGTFNAAAGTFTPALGATTSTFKYSITGTAPCPNEESIATVNISAYKTAGTNGNTLICDNSTTVINLFDLITGESTGGVWTRTSGTGGTFNNVAGTFTPALGATTSTFKYSITGTAPCPNEESIATVNISAYKTAGTNGNTSICDNSTTVINLFDLITGESTGGVWTRTLGTGGTFNAAAGTFTPALGATISTFKYSITGTAPCPNEEAIATVNISAYKTAGTSGNTPICDNSTTVINLFDLITGESTGGVWTRTSGTGGTFNNVAGTFTPALGATTSTFKYSITGTAPCPNEEAIATVNISAYKTAGTNGNTLICDNSTTVINLFDLITGESTGGVWTRTSGTGGTFNAAAGTFTPALGATNSTFTYSITGVAPCPNETSVATVNISAYKTAGTDGNTSVCDNSLAVINLFSLIGGESTGGVWTRTSGTGGVFVALTGTFIPAPGATTSTFKYSITGTAPCPNDESIATVNISPYKWAGDAGSLSVCDNSTNTINLSDVIIDEASGGVWTRTGGTGGTFDANAGTFTPALGATTSTFVYTITNPSPCVNSTSVAIIYVRPYKTAGTSGNTSICDNSTAAVNLFDLITGESTGGVWTRTGGTGGTFNAAAGTFVPASGATTSTFKYSITGTAPCPNEESIATVNISAYKTAGTSGNTSICDNSTTVINLFDLITGESTGGVWTRTSGTGGTFNQMAGTFTPALGATTSTFKYSITGTAPCPNEEAIATVNISAYKTAGADGNTSVCDYSATTINLFSLITGEDAGGVWTRVSGTGGTFNAAAGTFVPALGATTSIFAYSFTGIAPCDGDFSIVTVNVTPKPVAAIVPKTNVICANGVLPTFTATPNSGVTYEWYGPLSDTTSSLGTALSSTVASFTPTTAQINYIGIRYFAVIVKTTGAAICSDTAFVQLKVNPKPSVTPSSLAVCENTPGSGLGTFNLSSLNSTVGGSNSVSWFSNKERTTAINAPAAYISATGKAYAKVTILETGCSDTTSVSLTVQGKPVQINTETSCVATSNGSGKIVVTATAPAGGSLEYKLDVAGTYGSAATFNGVTNGNHTVYVRVVGSNCYDSTIVNINCFCTQPTLTVVDPAPVCSPMTVNITSSSVITTNTGVRTNYWKNAALTQPLDATTGPATAVKLSGTYYIKSMLSDSTCYTAKAVEVKINPLPVVKDTSLALCDLGNGKAVFNLLLAESAVKGMTNNLVSWYSNADRTVVIGTPSTYLSSSGKVYVRVTNPTTNCSDTTSVNLIIYAKPNAGVDRVGGTAICNTTATVDLPNAAQGESWSQLGNTPKVVAINANTGVVTGMDAIGTYRFILKNTITGCADTVSVETKNCLKGSIGDLVWKDLNDNGLQDLPTEKGVPNVIVQLLNANTAALLKTDTTDANGIYSFTGLEDGNYKVKIVLSSLPADCQLSTRQDAGGVNDDAIDSDFGPNGESPVVVINTLGTGLAKDNPTIDAALIKTCVQPTWQVTVAPVCSPTSSTYSVSFAVTNQIGVLKVNRGTLSGSNPYTVTGIPNGVNLVITDSLRASCKFINTIVAPDCSCPQITLLTPNATACKGDTLPTLKIFLAGSNTNGVGANWYSASTGGVLLGTGLNFKPSGTIAATMTFYIQLTGTTGACLNQPRTPVTVTALDCNVDLALKKSISTKIAQIGDVLTYTLKVWNQSGSNASGVEVTDSIAVTSQFQSGSFVASRGSATISNSVIKWVIGSIVANGDTVTLTYQVKATQQGLHFNTAEISKINEKDVDSTPGNGKDDEDDIDRQCFTVPVKLCATEKIQASVPAKYLNVRWFKDGGNTPIASGNTVLLTGEGTYTFTATNNVCPAGGCCPIIVEPAANCCPEDLCVPFTIKQTKKAGKVVR